MLNGIRNLYTYFASPERLCHDSKRHIVSCPTGDLYNTDLAYQFSLSTIQVSGVPPEADQGTKFRNCEFRNLGIEGILSI